MSDFELWCKVESAQCELEQLDSLMQLHNRDFLDVSAEDFIFMAKTNYAEMNTLATLMLNLLHRAKAELAETLRIVFSARDKQPEEVRV